jgi:hypothetical protein
MPDDNQHAKDNAAAWWETIKQLVAALDHSEWHQCSLCDNPEKCRDNAMCDLGEVGEDEESARQRIDESALCVEVRSEWHAPGHDDTGPVEYTILLTTGGPALRIYGQLGVHGEPDEDPMLQWQDWGTPWTDWGPEDASDYKDTLRTFASQFYFGG